MAGRTRFRAIHGKWAGRHDHGLRAMRGQFERLGSSRRRHQCDAHISEKATRDALSPSFANASNTANGPDHSAIRSSCTATTVPSGRCSSALSAATVTCVSWTCWPSSASSLVSEPLLSSIKRSPPLPGGQTPKLHVCGVIARCMEIGGVIRFFVISSAMMPELPRPGLKVQRAPISVIGPPRLGLL